MSELPFHDDEELDRQLAELDENPDALVDNTVRQLHADLLSLAETLKEPIPLDPHEDQSACRRAVEQAQALVRELAAANLPPETEAVGPMPERFDHFRVLKLLGQGGMGAVYLAEDTRLGRQVALKTMRAELAAKPAARERFLREARLAAAVEHDRIVPIYHVGESNDIPYLAMPVLKGQSLAELLKHKSQRSLAQVLRWGRQIAEGLTAAHEKGLIHRDIKPANIWLEASPGCESEEFRVKLLDFGLARLEQDDTYLTQSGKIVGTPAYMAPEQTRGEKVDARADLWSLGVVLYELLTGRRPFDAPNTFAVLSRIASDHPLAPHLVNRDIPAGLSELVMRLLEKDLEKRPGSAREVINALTEIEKSALASAQTAEAASPVLPKAEPGSQTTVTLPADSAGGPHFRFGWAVAAGLLFVLGGGLLLSQIIVVRDKDGNEVARITVPKGGKFEIVDLAKKPDDQKLPSPKGREDGGEGGDPDRRAAEWVLSIGGTVRVNAITQEILEPSELPKAPFRLTYVDLFNNSQVTDAGLAHFKDCKNLTHLNLYGTRATDAGLIHFEDCKNLTHLNLRSTEVTDAGLAYFKDCKNLTLLNLYGTRATDAGLAHFKDCKNLIYLDLSGTAITDAGLAYFEDCKDLTYLHLGGTRVTDAGLAYFQVFRSLQDLNLSNTQVTDAGLIHFKDCKNLRNLDLRSTRVTDAGMAHFKGCTSLETLKLSWTKVTDSGLAHFKNCKNLRFLTLEELQVTDAGLANFKDCKNLTELFLSDSRQVTDAGLAHLRDCKNLTNLHLRATQVTDGGLVHLKDCKNLQVLDLENTQITDLSLDWIQSQPLTGICSVIPAFPARGTNVSRPSMLQLG